MKQMYIPCANESEKQEVIKHLVSIGYIDEDTDDHYLNLRTHEDDCIQSVVDNHCGKLEIVTPQQLLNKQEQSTMNELKEAVQNSGFSKSELSRRLGKHHNYIDEMLRVGCSSKKQNELIEMINQVKAGERFKSDDEIIAELSEKLESAQDEAYKNRKQTISDGIFIAELQTKNNLLKNNLSDERKNAQELAGELEKEKASVRQLNGELIELSEFKDKLEGELTKAGEELLQQDELIQNKNEQIQRANDELILLNKENSELNKQRKSYMAAFFMLLSLVVICLLWSAFK